MKRGIGWVNDHLISMENGLMLVKTGNIYSYGTATQILNANPPRDQIGNHQQICRSLKKANNTNMSRLTKKAYRKFLNVLEQSATHH